MAYEQQLRLVMVEHSWSIFTASTLSRRRYCDWVLFTFLASMTKIMAKLYAFLIRNSLLSSCSNSKYIFEVTASSVTSITMRKLFNNYQKLFAKNREQERMQLSKKTSSPEGPEYFKNTPPSHSHKLPQVNEPPQTHRNLRDPRTQVLHANSAVSTRSRLIIKFTQECEALVAGSY